MPGNSFGNLFRISTFGESHGGSVGVVIDGCPAGLELAETDIQPALDRRKPGQSEITTPRSENDQIKIYSGVFEGKTTGSPILLMANNSDMRPEDYLELSKLYRPGHADFTFEKKYGHRDWRGSGRASARETLARVAAGAVAQKYLRQKYAIEFLSYVAQVGSITSNVNCELLTNLEIDQSIVRCPDPEAAKSMIAHIEQIKTIGDSVGGIIKGVIKNCPIGLGEPVFDKFPAVLGHAMLSINAVKGFDIGSGFDCVNFKGSEHNDCFSRSANNTIQLKTNHAGGTLGGITTGQDILFRVAFKPVSTISKEQETVNKSGEAIKFSAKGRHDPCVLPRAVPIVDAMAALVVMDFCLQQFGVYT